MLLVGRFKVFVGGVDVTSRWNPTLKSASVTRGAREASDTAQLTLADPGGQTFLPGTGDDLVVHFGNSADGLGQVFEGFVDSVRWRMDKSSGREISIEGSSVDHKSKVKAGALRSAADKTFSDVAKEWGSKVGLDMVVAGELGSVFRPYWLMQHESYMGWGQRMARDLGASFKIIGRRGFFAPLNEGISASGKTLTPVYGIVGQNVEDIDVTPIIGRPQYGTAKARYYDINSAEWREVAEAVREAGIDVDFRSLLGAANEGNAGQSAKSRAKESERERGDGSATILGDHTAEPEAKFILTGARPGIDGDYVIDSLTHSLDKKSGFTTALTLKAPAGGAGKDTRA
ncbi:phage late control D family protein [Devosia riboflavina]|uniref:phage late control D family protein n=1 Tax=Devosia riboflavina TaxID=46914 RepID=UPI00068FE2A6|nr:hypothetical protein [Devosia riboflavina]